MPPRASRQRLTSDNLRAQQEAWMKNDRKETDKKKGTLRPWLVDVAVEHLR
jgi:hypothetical protein